ncbi:uncharacterized protein [Epargyreus clarus]|uniref:uncharacterized protein n=1 Tax=Epargyreus clarus TaxID=520877 RepID=UPI003C303E98
MASKNEKICHLLSFLVMLVYFRIVTSTNIDCGGKPFHCVNSTHFMICVDVGSGVSQTVDDFTIQCPVTTVCRGSNYFECEYEVITTKEPTIRGDQEHIKETINGKTTVSPFQKNNATRLNEYVNTISVTAQPNITTDAYTQQPSAITEIKGISTTKNDIASTSELILSTTETYVAENLITTSPKTKSNDTSATLEKIKISKNNLLDKVTTLPSFSKPEKSIEANTTRNFTNETNNLQNIAENGEESLQKNETSYSQPPDTLLHNETTVQIGNDLSTLTSQDTPASYRNYLPVLTTLSDLVTLTTTDYFNKENITFNKTLSQDGQDSSRNVTTKLMLQNLTTVNTILSQNVNQTPTSNYDYSYSRMKDQTSTTALNLIHQRTENPFSSANATKDNHIPKEATSPNILTTNVNTLSTTVAPITNVPLSTDFKLRTKPVEDSTVTTESTTTEKNTNLTQYDVKTNKPLKSEVKPILQSITTMHATKNTTIATTVVPSTTVKLDQKPAGQYISESLTPVLMDESTVSANNRNPQMAIGSTGNIFNQNFENNANVMISDTRKTHLDMMTVSQNTLGTSLPATIDNMKLSVDNTFPTTNPQIPNKGIGNKLQYKNNNFENKGDMIHTDTVNTQPAKETITNHELTLLKPASTDEFKVSDSNMVTAINPHTVTGSTEKINESNNVKFGNKVDLVNSVTEYVRSGKVTTQSVLGSLSPALTDKITVSASDKITSKYLETTSESIGKVIDNSNLNNFENKVGMVIHDMVNTQPAQKTVVYSVLSSSTSAPRDEIQLSASSKIATINPQMLTGSTKEIVVNNNNNNNYENKAHVVIIDTVNTQPAQKTIAYSAFNSPTPASTAEIKVSIGNQFNAINPPGKTLHNSSSNNIANEVGVSINNKVNDQFATEETIAHLVGWPSTSMDKVKVSASNIVTTTTTKPVTKSVGNTLQHNNNNFQIKMDMVTSDMGNIHFAKETVAQALLSSTTRVSVDTLKFSSNNKITTNPHTVISSTERLLENNNINNNLELKTGVISEIANSQPAQNTKASNQIATLIPQITIGRTGKVFQNSNNNNFETKVDVISDAVNTKFAKETVARSVFVSSTPASADEIKVSASNNIATINQQTLTESTANILQYSNIKFKNKVDIISSDAVTRLSKATVAHPVFDSSTPVLRDEIKVLDSYTLTSPNPHFATRSMGKMVLTNDNLVNEQKVHTIDHESPGSHPTSLRFEGTKNNESINVLQNEPVTVSINNIASKFSAHSLSVKVSIDAMPNNVSKNEFNKSPYENTTTKETILTLPTVQVRNKLNNPILLKNNETSKKNNSDINKVQNRNAANMTIQPIYSNNKRHEQVLKQTTLPQLKVAGRQLQNKLHNNTAVTKDNRTIAMKDIFTCQNRLRGRYADANDCRKFYICIGRIQPLLGECPVNTVFSEIKKQCTKNLSHCIRHNQFRCIKSGRFSDALKNNVYYICVQNKNTYVRFQFQCQGGYHLNKQRVKCVSDIKSQQMSKSIDNDSNKASAQSTVENKSKEKKQNKEKKAKSDNNVCKKEGKFPDPDDCRKYFVCSKNSKSVFRRRTKKCDSDEVFHPEKEKCVDSDSYECD